MKPYEFFLMKDRHIIHEVVTGKWNHDTAKHYLTDFQTAVSPLLNSAWGELVDFRHWQTAEREVASLYAQHLRWGKDHRMVSAAVVVTSCICKIQLQRLVSESGIEKECRFFTNEQDAFAWLTQQGL